MTVPPQRVGPFAVLSVIGRGGIGTVYRARHQETGALVAVKVLGPSPAVEPTAARRLAREYEVLRTLDHPHVVHVLEAGVTEGYSYLAMELVEGLDLRAYLSPALDADPRLMLPPELLDDDEPPTGPDLSGSTGEVGPEAIRALAAMMDEPETEEARFAGGDAPDGAHPDAAEPQPLAPEALAALNRPARVARLRTALAQVADALGYLHGRGIVHRDLKPTNIMVDDRRRARIMDFGLVKASEGDAPDEVLTQTGRIVGTYRYMSPEQAQGHAVDGRSDLYSLGVILYELLSGHPPFVARDPVALWREILHVRPPPLALVNPGVDPALAVLAARLLEKDPAKRPQSAGEVLEILRAGVM